MKKTLTVNLGGTVYHIDEDAYILLDNYLNNLRYHFRKNKEAEEIVHDMEVRIAELFDEYIQQGKQVITIEAVESVITRMGKPEELNDGFETEDNSESSTTAQAKQASRRIFRNPDDRILGGVVSGLAAYLGWDITWLRVGFIVAGIAFQGLILFYLIAWILFPLARTATEKLQMRGEPINVENIGRTVTDGFERANEYVHSEQPRSLFHRLGSAFVTIVGFLLKVFLVIVAICCAPALLIGLIILFALFMAATGILVSFPASFYSALPGIDWNIVSTAPGVGVALSVCGLLAVGIPIIGLLQLIMQAFNVWKPMSTTVKIILIFLWMIALACGIVFMLQAPFIEYFSTPL